MIVNPECINTFALIGVVCTVAIGTAMLYMLVFRLIYWLLKWSGKDKVEL